MFVQAVVVLYIYIYIDVLKLFQTIYYLAKQSQTFICNSFLFNSICIFK